MKMYVACTHKHRLIEAIIVRFNIPLFYRSNQDPVVQSVVSLTSSLRVISLTILVDSIYNILNFFC